jgi:Sec-independent protein translocase protein TatA
MFDNFGLGEFFFLALLALLFFGPERLPQIGARLGRWVGNMTQYSKAFMTEWREEALAIHDAVEEVKGIRDEIVAAQREISGTLDTARGDMVEGLDAAKEAVTDATRDVTTRIQQQRLQAAQDFDQLGDEESGPGAPASGTDAAISRTQEVLAGLEKRRASTRGTVAVEEAAADTTLAETIAAAGAAEAGAAEAPATETPDGRTPSEMPAAASGTATASPGDEEWERIHRLIEEGMRPQDSKDSQVRAQSAAAGEPAAAPAAASSPASRSPTARTTDSGATAAQGSSAEKTDTEPGEAPEPPKESAFDRTQKVLENLRKRRAGITEESPAAPEAAEAGTEPVAEAEPESTPPMPRETAFDRTQQVLQNLKRKREGRDQGTPAKVPFPPVNRDDFERLSSEVLELRDQMEALRNELRALRALASQASASADDVSIEEVA